jgi:indolepyruvate ferredoxin oxidoreductase
LRIYKVALTWPLEEHGARRFAEGLQDVLVVEEKRGFIEDQLKRILYNVDALKRPSVVGKLDEAGAPLLPSEGELTPTMVASALVARLRRLGQRQFASISKTKDDVFPPSRSAFRPGFAFCLTLFEL